MTQIEKRMSVIILLKVLICVDLRKSVAFYSV